MAGPGWLRSKNVRALSHSVLIATSGWFSSWVNPAAICPSTASLPGVHDLLLRVAQHAARCARVPTISRCIRSLACSNAAVRCCNVLLQLVIGGAQCILGLQFFSNRAAALDRIQAIEPDDQEAARDERERDSC